MRHVFTQLRARSIARTLTGTRFCDACACLSTPADRHDALRERSRTTVYEAMLFRR